MPMPTIKLKPQRPERLTHPWIYDNEIANGPDAGFEDGGVVKVVDARNRALGVGYLNTQSKIAVRYLSRDPGTSVNARFWRARLAAAAEYRRARYAGHGEADGLPGLVVDIYGDYAVAQFLARGLEPWRDAIIQGIVEAADVKGIYERSDSAVRKLEGLEEQPGLIYGEDPPATIEYVDDGVTVLVDVREGGKTGLFLDQRDTQRAAALEATGRDVLNCFSY